MGSEPCRAEELVIAVLARHAGRRLARKGAAYLAPECMIDWPGSGERIVGRSSPTSRLAIRPTEIGGQLWANATTLDQACGYSPVCALTRPVLTAVLSAA